MIQGGANEEGDLVFEDMWEGVVITVTYGDPAFYGRVGFKPITQTDAPAPFALRHSEGWLGQTLTDAVLTPLRGPARCVPALDDPVFW